MAAFVVCVLVVLLMMLAVSKWRRSAQRQRWLDEASDQRMPDFVIRNAGSARGVEAFQDPPVRPAHLAEQYFDDLATESTPHTGLEPGGFPDDVVFPHPAINPASGLPMLNSAVDVAGNPFGSNLSDGMHQATHMRHSSDSFGGHSLPGHSIGSDFQSGHDTFGHGSSWID
jgi:hypothetical protein